LSDSFVTYPRWLYAWGSPLTLIGEDASQIAAIDLAAGWFSSTTSTQPPRSSD